jgi:hypothetical protein
MEQVIYRRVNGMFSFISFAAKLNRAKRGNIRYCNMDYIIFSALAGVKLRRIVITYDIGCQWCKNVQRRMEELPDDLKLDLTTMVKVGIPSWHINGHGKNCKTFCLSYMDGVGRTCGEEVEMTWAQMNALGTSVREMGPGARHETLNDQWCGSNFQKIIAFRMRLHYWDQMSANRNFRPVVSQVA